MPIALEKTNKFLNSREWRTFPERNVNLRFLSPVS
jgi:hypothetical protein